MSYERETFTRFRCARCTGVVEVKTGLLGWAPIPSSWKKVNHVLFCSQCFKEYNSQYTTWFAQFMKSGKTVK